MDSSGDLAANTDHEEVIVDDVDDLYRLITDDNINDDGSLKSNAFAVGNGDISVDIAKLTTPEQSVERLGKPGVKPAVFKASVPKSLGHPAVHDPQPNFWSHAVLSGTYPKIPRSVRRRLASECKVLDGYVSIGSQRGD